MKRGIVRFLGLGTAMALLLTACGASVTGVSLSVPDVMEKGDTALAEPTYTYSSEEVPDESKADQLLEKLDMQYSSSNPDVVMVDAQGNLAAVSAGTAQIYLSSADGKINSSAQVRVTVTPTGITMPESLALVLGSEESGSAAATVSPEDASDYTVEYRSGDEAVATVAEDGTVTALSAGQTTVTASIRGTDLEANCQVTVSPAIEELDLESSLTLAPGDTHTLNLSARPEGADLKGAAWSSSDENVVTVDSAGALTAVAEGEATVTAQVGGKTASCQVTVRRPSSGGSSGSGSSGGSSSSSSGSTAYGAVPFEAAAGTLQWFVIESTDSAYQATLENINAYRAAVGVAPLSADANLSSIATQRCIDMLVAGVMSHDGYQTAEIIAQNYNSAQSVVDAWANSPGHYAAMTSPDYTACGIGCAFEEGGATYWCVTLQ